MSTGPYRSLNLGILTDDDPERVTENRRRLAAEARVAGERVVMGWQVHGSDLRERDGPGAPRTPTPSPATRSCRAWMVT